MGDDSTSQKYITIKDNGNVGIGTTSPLNKLHTEDIRIGNWQGNGNWFRFCKNSNADLQIDYMSASSVHKTMMVMDYNTGNIGIGTTSPDTKLQVNGDFH